MSRASPFTSGRATTSASRRACAARRRWPERPARLLPAGHPYYVFNYQREFRKYVIDYFLKEYTQGYTPNLSLECNREVKFRALQARAQALGFDYVATGHYARIRKVEDGGWRIEDRGHHLAIPLSSLILPSSV